MGLERDGFVVHTSATGQEGIRKAYEHHPDVIILDVMMDGMDGWTTCQRLRQVCDTPILMLTALASGDDIIKGLSLGADDYLTKPCDFAELRARIRALLRRSGDAEIAETRRVYDDGVLHVDPWNGIVKLEGRDGEPDAHRISLVDVPGQPTRADRVPQRAAGQRLGPRVCQRVGYLSVYIRYLRRKIEQDPANPRYICTRWKVGYYFAQPSAQ